MGEIMKCKYAEIRTDHPTSGSCRYVTYCNKHKTYCNKQCDTKHEVIKNAKYNKSWFESS